MISRPKQPADYSGRIIDCEMSAEDEFRALAERTEAAGWTGDEAAAALLSLSLYHIEFRKATTADEQRISDARKKAGH